ncbi:MAG TPA: response regulator [Gammaproteobacteria bacterium]|nr:response regulator [Gammaproteobacteria bacterium]
MTPAQFTSFASPLPDALCLVDITGQIIVANPAAVRLFAQDSQTLCSKTLFDLIIDEQDKLEQTLRIWSGSHDATPGVLQVRVRSGESIPCHGYGNLIQSRTDDGPALIMLRIVTREKFTQSFKALNEKIALLQREIMERRKTENALAYSKVQFEAVFNAIPDAVIFADTERRMMMNNPAVHAMFGFSDEELIGQKTEMLYADKQIFTDQGRRRFHIGSDPKTGAYEVQYRRKDGSQFWAETLGTQVKNRKGEIMGFIGLLRDITERKHAEKQMRESEQRLADAQRMTHIGNWELNLVSYELTWSDEIYRIFEVDPLEFDASYEAFLDAVHPDDRERVKRTYAESVKNKTLYSVEHRLRMPDDTVKHVVESCQTFYNDDNLPVRSIGTIQDITERVSMEEALRRSQKMEAIGQLSGGIAHDFNNQLGVIIGYLDFLKNHFPENEKPRQWVETATRATLRCMDLTRQLLAFSRRQSSEKSVVDLNASIKEMETMITRSVTPEVEVQYSLSGELWLAEIDPGGFQDVILNLVINARDAMPYGGKLLIETGNRCLDADYPNLNPDIESGDYVQLTLSDSGSGMDKETIEHIFEPFFTTKPEGEGTGLGMAMVYGFVKRNGGYIKVYSEPDVGTTIRIYLPRSAASDAVDSVSAGREIKLPGGKESILIVEDEADLLALADGYLEELGYHTRLAENAAQALEILAGGQEFDLLFSDVVMPGGMNGYELVSQVTRMKPDLKVLLTSGYTAKKITHDGLERFSANILAKPYRKPELAQRIRLVLDERMERVENRTNAHNTKECLEGRIILVVDDEEDVRELFKFNLERLGYKVIQACNGNEAIVLYQQSLESGEPVDAVLLDLSLPGSMDGKEVSDKIRNIDPDARIIVASGHTTGPEMTQYKDYGFNGALDKNFNREKIRQVLEQVLSPIP